MKTALKPKYSIGQKVFYVAYIQYDENEDNAGYVFKPVEIYDYIVLYGTVESIKVDSCTVEYELTVEEHKGLKKNNVAVFYREENTDKSLLRVNEADVFSLDELALAKKRAKSISNQYKKKVKSEEKLREQAQCEENTYMVYAFLLREFTEFDISYTEEEINALYKMASSPRVSLMSTDFESDLVTDCHFDTSYYEQFGSSQTKEYIELLNKGLKLG